MKRTILATGVAIVMFGFGCGTRINEALLLALESGARTGFDVFLSDLLSDLPNFFTFPPPTGEPGDGDGDSTDGDDGDGDQPPPDGNGGDLVGDPVAGEALYGINGCGLCHCDDASGECLPGSPGLQGSSLEVNREALQGESSHVGGKFPDLTEQDLADLVAFLADVGGGSDGDGGGNGDVVGDPVAGEAFYNANACGACHCADGSGGCAASAPDIRAVDTNTILETLAGEASHTGGKIADVTEQEVADLAAFLGG
jgi:mono/diheme cytochrome c family protein